MADKKISALTAATTPLAGTEVLPIVQSGATVKVANNDLRPKQIQSNATSGVLQITGPAAASTRVMTTPDANFTAARTDAAQTFTGINTFNSPVSVTPETNGVVIVDTTGTNPATGSGGGLLFQQQNSGGVQTNYASIYGYRLNNAANDIVELAIATGSPSDARPITKRMSFDTLGNITFSNGNFVQGTAAKGVNFTANTPASGMTSQLLNWYEEGTWTPTLVAAGVNFTSVTYDAVTGGRYTRIGNVVHIQGRLRTDAVTVGSASGDVCIGNLPFTAVANGGSTSNGASAISIGYVAANWAANRAPISGQVAANTTRIELYYRSAVDGTCVNLVPADVGTGADANTVYFAGTYIVS